MSSAAANLLNSFNALPVDEQREVALRILRQVQEAEYAPLTDDELSAIAEDTLLFLDEGDRPRADAV
jgi:hypothetical protein